MGASRFAPAYVIQLLGGGMAFPRCPMPAHRDLTVGAVV